MLLQELRERAEQTLDRSRTAVIERIKNSFTAVASGDLRHPRNPDLKVVAEWEILPLPTMLRKNERTALCRFETDPQSMTKDEQSSDVGKYAPRIEKDMLSQSVLVRQPPGNTYGFYLPVGQNVMVDRVKEPQRLNWIREYATVPIAQPKQNQSFILEIQPEDQLQQQQQQQSGDSSSSSSSESSSSSSSSDGRSRSHRKELGVTHYTRLDERISLRRRFQTKVDDANRDILQRPATLVLQHRPQSSEGGMGGEEEEHEMGRDG